MSLQPVVSIYRYVLEPVAPFAWFAIKISSLELAAAFRLCAAVRQIRDTLRAQHQRNAAADKPASVEERSFLRDACTALTIKFGGEAIIAPLLGVSPSFVLSGVSPGVFVAAQAIVDSIPASLMPSRSLSTELALSVVDAFTRAFLFCSLIPRPIITHASPAIASSPWTLLLSSLVIANGGLFITNMFSFLEPTPLTLRTPGELKPYGWTATDLWCAPLITGLYALLTHAQPFWGEAHGVLSTILGGAGGGKVEPLDPESARALCALVLAGIYSARASKNFGSVRTTRVAEKMKVQ